MEEREIESLVEAVCECPDGLTLGLLTFQVAVSDGTTTSYDTGDVRFWDWPSRRVTREMPLESPTI